MVGEVRREEEPANSPPDGVTVSSERHVTVQTLGRSMNIPSVSSVRRLRRFKVSELPAEEKKKWMVLTRQFAVAFLSGVGLCSAEQDQLAVKMWKTYIGHWNGHDEPTNLEIRAVTFQRRLRSN